MPETGKKGKVQYDWSEILTIWGLQLSVSLGFRQNVSLKDSS
jgi:hypothetical protein